MAANGISTLATKELRQKAKLELAAANRLAIGRPNIYDAAQLPNRYEGNSAGTDYFTADLLVGRPWTLVTASELKAHWDPADYSGTGTLADKSGTSNVGTLVGTPTFDSNNGYFTLDGVNDYIRSGNLLSAIGSPDTFTAEVWIYPTNLGVVLSITNTTTPATSYHFSAMEFTNSGGKPLPGFGIWNAGIVSDTGTALEFNTWYQMTITYDAVTTTMKGYVNGAEVASASVTFDSPTDGAETEHYLLFGATADTNQGDGTYFNGRMGIIRIYNKALSPAEVTTNYNANKDRYGM